MIKHNLLLLLFCIAIIEHSCKNPSQKQAVSTDSVVKTIVFDTGQTNDKVPTNTATSGFFKDLSMGTVSFKVSCPNRGSLNTLTIVPKGIDINDTISVDVDGTVTDAVIADLDADSYPEVYCFANSAGSGSYGKVYGYASNKNKSMSPIFLPQITDDKKLSAGYMGHDTFKVDQNRLVRSFPVYKKDDPNVAPSGGIRTVSYKLKPGEAGWILDVDNVKE